MLIDDHPSNAVLGVVYACRGGPNGKTDAFPVSVCIYMCLICQAVCLFLYECHTLSCKICQHKNYLEKKEKKKPPTHKTLSGCS